MSIVEYEHLFVYFSMNVYLLHIFLPNFMFTIGPNTVFLRREKAIC